MARPIDGNSYVGGEDNYSDGEDVQVHTGVRQVAENQDTELSRAGVGSRPDDAFETWACGRLIEAAKFLSLTGKHSSRFNSDRCSECGRPFDREEDFSNVGRVTKPV